MNIRLLVLIAFITSISIYKTNAYTYNNERLSVLLSKAQKLEEEKQYKTAIDVYNEALKIASDKEHIEDASYIYKKVGLIYYKQKEYKKAKSNFKNSILKTEHSKNAADSYFNLSLIYRKQKVKDSLLWSLNKSLNIFNKLEDSKTKFSTYSKAGIIYKQLGMYDKAIRYLLLAYDGFSKLENIKKKASVSGNIADVQRILGNLDISKIYYREQLALTKKFSDTLKLSFAYNNLANLFYEEKQYDSALAYYKKGLQIQMQFQNIKNIGKTSSNIGLTYFKLKDLDKAKEYYQKALKLKKQAKDTNAMVQTLSELALISINQKNNSVAKYYLDSAENCIFSTTNKSIILRNYFVKSKYYESIGNFQKAYENQTLEFELNKKMFSEEQAKTIQTLQEQFESHLKEKQISELTIDNQQKIDTISFQKQRLKNRDLMLVVLGLLLLFFIGVYFYLKQRQKNKIQNLENQKLKEVLEGQEIIKDHISKDLHDMIPTSYDAIRLKILALAKVKEPEKLSQSIIEDIQNINRDIRLISHRLSPLGDKIKEASLTEIIISHFSEFQHYRQIFMDVQLPLPKQLNAMTLQAQTHIYGIILEILNNVEKHSKATKISVQHGITTHNKMTLKFCDDGIGIQNKSSEGIGLTNIKQRTLLLGGLFNIESNTEGTCIELTIPITPNLK